MAQKSIFGNAEWIVPLQFKNVTSINIFHREEEKINVELPEELKNLHIVYRVSFYCENIKNLKLRITADDYYKLYVNGNFLGQGPAQGYHYHYYWNEYDVNDVFKVGKNEILVDVYYQGLINRAYVSGDRRLGLIAAVFDETGYIFGTSEAWECAISNAYEITHTIGYDTIFAENVDLRKKARLFGACAEKKHEYIFAAQATKTLSVYEKKAKNAHKIDGGFQYDFGEEITGGICLRAKGAAGDKIVILLGEELDDAANRVRYEMRCNSVCKESVILAEGENFYTQYEYKGFRYAEVLCDGGVEIISVSAVVRHYPFDGEYCQLQTDNKILKSVWDMCKRSVQWGSQEVYVDCPTREKGQYTGDMVITSSAQVLLTGDTSLLKKAIDDVMQSAKISQGLMAVAPSSLMQEIADYSLQFPILALRYYRYNQDKDYLTENLKVCENLLSYYQKFARTDGLLEDVTEQWNLVDWPQNLRDGYDFPLTRPIKKGSGAHNVINAFYVGCIMGVEQIRDILGVSYENKSEALIETFNKEFFNPETGLYTDCKGSKHSSLHSNVIPLYYGISRGKDEDKIADFLVQKKLCCGVYMAYYFLKGLCRVGRELDAYSFIISTDENSWYNMVKEGATTCFEAWSKEQKCNTSLCHPWACAPISVMIEDILPKHSHIGKITYKIRIGGEIE